MPTGARQRKLFRFDRAGQVRGVFYLPGRAERVVVRLCSWAEARVASAEDGQPVYRTARDRAWSLKLLLRLHAERHAELLREAERTQPARGRRPLAELAGLHREALAARGCADGTLAAYEDTAGKLLAALGPVTAAELDLRALDRLVAWMAERHLAPATMNLHLRNLRALVHWAQERGEMDPGLRVREVRAPRKIAVVPKAEDVRRLFRRLAARKLSADPRRAAAARKMERFAMVAAGLGPRRGEVAFARWAALDLERGVLPVRKSSWLRIKEQREKDLRMPAWLLTYLKAERALFPNEVHVLGDGPKGAPAYQHLHSLTTAFYRLLGELGLRAKYPGIKPTHVFRALYATRLREQGVDRRTIGGLLGQSNPESTEHYFGAEEGMQLAAVRLLDDQPPTRARRRTGTKPRRAGAASPQGVDAKA